MGSAILVLNETKTLTFLALLSNALEVCRTVTAWIK